MSSCTWRWISSEFKVITWHSSREKIMRFHGDYLLGRIDDTAENGCKASLKDCLRYKSWNSGWVLCLAFGSHPSATRSMLPWHTHHLTKSPPIPPSPSQPLLSSQSFLPPHSCFLKNFFFFHVTAYQPFLIRKIFWHTLPIWFSRDNQVPTCILTSITNWYQIISFIDQSFFCEIS